jgi:hypothetical protein
MSDPSTKPWSGQAPPTWQQRLFAWCADRHVHRGVRVALLDRDFVLAGDTTPERLASVIIHEMTHARLERAGVQYVGTNRARSERVCALAERNFIARLPPSAERGRLEKLNAQYLAIRPDFWTDASFAERLATWRKRQPIWRRTVHDLLNLFWRAHHAASFSLTR